MKTQTSILCYVVVFELKSTIYNFRNTNSYIKTASTLAKRKAGIVPKHRVKFKCYIWIWWHPHEQHIKFKSVWSCWMILKQLSWLSNSPQVGNIKIALSVNLSTIDFKPCFSLEVACRPEFWYLINYKNNHRWGQ